VGDTPIALQLLKKMVELKFPKQQLCISYNSVISSVAKYIADNPQKANFMVDKAEQIFAEMKQNNVKPDLFTFNSLLNVYACSASMESSKRAEELIKFLQNDTDLVPDIFSYSCVIDALAKSGDIQAGPRALAILHKMEVKPNVVSYNSVIAAYRNDPSRAKEAEAVLEEMIKKRINPNMTTFATLISGWSKSNSFDKAKQARRVLDLMMTKFEDLEESKKTEIERDTCRNAHSLVVKTCSMLPDKADGAYRTEALEIATKTLEETPDPSAISYSTYFWAVSALLDNVEDRDRLITDAFRRYRSGSERVDDRVLRSLKQTISSDSYERLV